MRKITTIDKAIESLQENYKLALTLDWVRNPLAWAFYATWKELEGR